MQVFFERREELVPGIWQYYFRPERPFDFEPGQYVDLHLAGVKGDPRGAARTFSMTSLPTDPSITFVLKHFGLQSQYKHALQALQPGEAARLDDAMGDLILPKDPSVPLVFVAGGIGIASYASMLKLLLQKKEARDIFLFYQLRNRREQILRELTTAYPLALFDISIAPNQLSAQQIKASTPPGALLYLSGSQTFVETLRAGLEALDTPRSQIVFDYYDGYADEL